MDLLDVVILVLLAGAVASGWRRGLSWVGFSLLGLVAGVLLGAAISPPLADAIAGHDRGHEAFIVAGIFLTTVALVQGVGTAIGYQIRIATLRSALAGIDSGLGALFAGLGVLAGAWYLGLTFANSPFPRLDRQIRDSAILRALDAIAPRPPAFLGALSQLLNGTTFPNPFAGLAPVNLAPVEVPPDANTPGVLAAARAVTKVVSSGCGIEAGSSWPVAPDYLVTNAHVVAGGQEIAVVEQDGRRLPATVVLFDPEVDVAVLYVPHLGLQPLVMAGNDPTRGVGGAVIGYPGGGSEAIASGAVRGVEEAQGRDIYGTGLVTRRIEVLQGNPPPGGDAFVIPGDSGGPMVDRSGTVIGLVFAASTDDPSVGYALTPSQIRPDLQAGVGRTAAVDTGGCAA